MHRAAIAFLLAVAWLCPRAAVAADQANCALKLANTVPITMAYESQRALVPVTINGTQKQFLLDTGGYATQISAAAAQELKLPVTESNIKLLDLYGNASEQAVKVETFALGRLSGADPRMPITTFPQNDLYSGILATDYMARFDIELDFAGGKMNFFLQDHCPGKVVYWPSAATAVVPMRFRDHQLILDISLDGHAFKAIVDTGAPGTTLSMAEANRVFDLKAEDRNKSFEHVFQKLSFEGLEVANPTILVIPDQVGSKDRNNSAVTGSRVHRVDDVDPTEPAMLIGMNILSKLHLYIAFSENKIYITPAAKPAP